MGCSHSSVKSFEFTTDNVNDCNITTNPIFNYGLSQERLHSAKMQLTIHGGVNHLLKINGLEAQNNSFEAIKLAYKSKLIQTPMLNLCKKYNQEGNGSKHNWTV
jgi:hypothetical protein